MSNYSKYITNLNEHIAKSKRLATKEYEPIQTQLKELKQKQDWLGAEQKFWSQFEMIFVRGGRFVMGDYNSGYSDQKPARNISIASFAICKYPITQFMWEFIMENNPSKISGENLPVTNISYNKIQRFINILEDFINTKATNFQGKFYLPTETQWEYAAKGGLKSKHDYKFSGSNDLDEVGWYKENSGGNLKPVGKKRPNELGICDLSGNVFELCRNFYTEDYRTKVIDKNKRVARGGSFNHDDNVSTVTRRVTFSLKDNDIDNMVHSELGFRLVMELK